MARLDKKSIISLTGGIGELSFYRMSGYDGVVVRRKGGFTSEGVKKSPKLVRTRENGVEFGGCSTAGKHIREMLRLQKTGAQLSIPSDINACLRTLTSLDTTSRRGERHVLISRGGQALEGLALNKGDLFDAILRGTLVCTPSRDAFSARLDIPELAPGVNLRLPGHLPMYRVVATLAYVPDFFYAGPKKKYRPAPGHITNGTTMVETPWYSAVDGSPPITLDLHVEMPAGPPDEHFSLLLAVAIHQGVVSRGMQVKHDHKAGAAKILKVF